MLFIVGIGQHKAVGELPSHNHSATALADNQGVHTHSYISAQGGSWKQNWAGANDYVNLNEQTGAAGGHSHTVTVNISNAGGNSAHNIMQPHLSVFMWQRTA